jgi:S1-C subfamily serine protease
MKPRLPVWVSLIGLGLAAAPARAQAPSLVDVFKRVNPAVVEIHIQETYPVPGPGNAQARVSALGSGVLISDDGRILTAAHLVEMADVIEVEFLTGERLPARVASSEPEVDLAYLKLERMPRHPSVAILGDSDRIEVGQPVFVIGAPLGLSHSLTVGHVSGHHRQDVAGATIGLDVLQTDAAINEGNSGGPLFNMDGEVIGIVSRILSVSGGSDGVGLAVTSNVARRLLVEKAFWSGLEGRILSGDLAKVFNVPPPGVGLLVQRVAAGSPAERAGLRGGRTPARIGDEELIVGGDIVLRIMGTSLDQPASLAAVREKAAVAPPGQEVEVVVLRGGRTLTLTSTVPPRD